MLFGRQMISLLGLVAAEPKAGIYLSLVGDHSSLRLDDDLAFVWVAKTIHVSYGVSLLTSML